MAHQHLEGSPVIIVYDLEKVMVMAKVKVDGHIWGL